MNALDAGFSLTIGYAPIIFKSLNYKLTNSAPERFRSNCESKHSLISQNNNSVAVLLKHFRIPVHLPEKLKALRLSVSEDFLQIVPYSFPFPMPVNSASSVQFNSVLATSTHDII